MKKWLVLFCLFAAPLHAQTIPQDFHAWFDAQIAGQPATQQTLDRLSAILTCAGSAVTPPNAQGQKSKIYDSQTKQWTRVIEGDPLTEGSWTWVPQGVDAAPPPQVGPCTAPLHPSEPIPTSAPSLETVSVLAARLDSLTVSVAAIAAQNERIFAKETQQITNLSDQLKAHDEKTNRFLSLAGNALEFAGKYIAPAVGAWIVAKRM